MTNMGLESAFKIRVNVLDLGIISIVLKAKSKSHDIELVYREKNPERKTFRSSWLNLGEGP